LFDKRANILGKGPYKSISRNREFMVCLDFNKKYNVFKNDEFLFQFSDFRRKEIAVPANFFRILVTLVQITS